MGLARWMVVVALLGLVPLLVWWLRRQGDVTSSAAPIEYHAMFAGPPRAVGLDAFPPPVG